jgi:hypothetical protein
VVKVTGFRAFAFRRSSSLSEEESNVSEPRTPPIFTPLAFFLRYFRGDANLVSGDTWFVLSPSFAFAFPLPLLDEAAVFSDSFLGPSFHSALVFFSRKSFGFGRYFLYPSSSLLDNRDVGSASLPELPLLDSGGELHVSFDEFVDFAYYGQQMYL